jgi:hypothetical protein
MTPPKYIYICIFSLFLGLLHVQAQNNPSGIQYRAADSTKAKKPPPKPQKYPVPFKPTGLRIGTNVAAPLYHLIDGRSAGFEGNAELLFDNKYFLRLAAGLADVQLERDLGAQFQMQGQYAQIGAAIAPFYKPNSELKYPTRDVFFVGAMLGLAQFNQSLRYDNNSALWGNTPISWRQDKLLAAWLNFGLGFRVEVVKNIFMGWEGSYNLRLALTESKTPMAITDVPGFKQNDRTGANWQLGFLLMYQLPLRKNNTAQRTKKPTDTIAD